MQIFLLMEFFNYFELLFIQFLI